MLFKTEKKFTDFALLLIRLGVGLSFIFLHGYGKITGGVERWEGLGRNMGNLGIDLFPVFWGFMAAFSEFFGAILIVLGILFRPACLLLFFTMFVAVLAHLSAGDPLAKASHAMELAVVFVALFLAGPGKYSLEQQF